METTTLDEVLAAKNVASTGDYILAKTSGGETVRISMADLAKVVAGLVPTVTTTTKGMASPYMCYAGSIGQSNRVVKIVTNGEYKFTTLLLTCYKDGNFCMIFLAVNGANTPYKKVFLQTSSSAAPLVMKGSGNTIYVKYSDMSNSQIGVSVLGSSAPQTITATYITANEYAALTNLTEVESMVIV